MFLVLFPLGHHHSLSGLLLQAGIEMLLLVAFLKLLLLDGQDLVAGLLDGHGLVPELLGGQGLVSGPGLGLLEGRSHVSQRSRELVFGPSLLRFQN